MTGRVFFSVDVETSDTNPWDGHLLTIGVEAVSPSGDNLGEFYVRLRAPLDAWWFLDDVDPQTDTARWWSEQDRAVRDEAYLDPDLVRHPDHVAAAMLSEFVIGLAPEPEDRVFVANPVAFDKAWIDKLYATAARGSVAERANPFHYRSLCLRSMKFGLRPHSTWGNDRETHAPKIPHHALWDAKAQADDLRSMLTERDGPQAVTT